PQVMAYWLMSARIARAAASLMTCGAGKLGKPCARLMARCSFARRVMARMTDSVNPWVRRAVCTRQHYSGLAALHQYEPGPIERVARRALGSQRELSGSERHIRGGAGRETAVEHAH